MSGKMALLFLLLAGLLTPSAPAEETYLFSYFTGNGEDGLHLAYSRDGLSWKPLKKGKSFLTPEVGGKLMRDPSVVQAPDGVFHMVWTVDWWMKSIGYAHSVDLVHWSEQRLVPVMAHETTAKNSWAPELFYDSAKEEYLIFWATTIPGRFPKAHEKDDNNHRMYFVTTKDFKTFSETKLWYDPGFNVIDSMLVKAGEEYVMFVKDERRRPPQKNIRIATAKHAKGPYGAPSKPITGDYWAEGPTAILLPDGWTVYFDKYRKGKYGAVQSKDLKSWTDISERVDFPEGARHGTVFRVKPEILAALLALSPMG
jgi:hypothetical protein